MLGETCWFVALSELPPYSPLAVIPPQTVTGFIREQYPMLFYGPGHKWGLHLCKDRSGYFSVGAPGPQSVLRRPCVLLVLVHVAVLHAIFYVWFGRTDIPLHLDATAFGCHVCHGETTDNQQANTQVCAL
ncbi:hypothetical protein TNCV_2793131 [Trichonephila clavipes]|nr:hypothetical protein TNCV_2793131 [Trichonephila clavipes]